MSTAKSDVRRGKYLSTVPAQEILPIVDSRYESNVRGIFLVGDVTGLPLVKVAANQGVEVIKKMESLGRLTSDDESQLDLVIIGAGPAGIAAAIEASQRGLRYVVLERSQVASTVRSFPPGKKVYAEPQSVSNASGIQVAGDVDKDEFIRAVESAVAEHSLKIKENAEVARVKKQGEASFEIEMKQGSPFRCRNVIVAVGRQGQPRLLDVEGAELSHKVTYRFHTAEDYVHKKVLIVGGGNSAIEAALMLKDRNEVTISYRGDNFFRAKEENRELLEAAIAKGELQVIYESQVAEIRESEVDLKSAGQIATLENDHVIVLIGSLPPIDFLYDMGLELDGIWNRKRFVSAAIGLAVGIFVYFVAKYFVLLPEKAG
ncbi:MAG: NAD(P)-binding domain-containing protein, partial [Planctomycetota bacterium]